MAKDAPPAPYGLAIRDKPVLACGRKKVPAPAA